MVRHPTCGTTGKSRTVLRIYLPLQTAAQMSHVYMYGSETVRRTDREPHAEDKRQYPINGSHASVARLTPDGRYLILRGRLWRATNPHLLKEEDDVLVKSLLEARRMKGVAMRANDAHVQERARQAVDQVKRQLGERGDV